MGRPLGARRPMNSVRVGRRHVIYMQGYDPRGLAVYYRMFRREHERFCALYGFDGHIGGHTNVPDRFSTFWKVSTRGPGWQVETTYEFLRWEDLIRNDFDRPIWWTICQALRVLVLFAVDGTLGRFARASWRFVLFVVYPYVVLLAFVLVAAGIGLVAAWISASMMPPPLAHVVGLGVAAVVLVLLIRASESNTFMLYLFDALVSAHEFAHHRRPDWEERYQRFADYLADTIKTSQADELIVVGHSSGSCVAVDVMRRLLERTPDLGCYQPRVALLTIGANLPLIGFQPAADWFRAGLARLATERSFEWVDYQSRHDVINIYPFDPISGHGIDVGDERCNPTVIKLSFRDLIKPENFEFYRWRFYSIHFQFLMANQRPAPYDYFMIVCGPLTLAQRAKQATAASAVVPAEEPVI
jgi:hypothetical protein